MLRFACLMLSTAMVFVATIDQSAAQSLRAEPRVFARGVLTTIEPELLPEETYSRQPMIEITSNQQLAWDPATMPETRTLYSKAQHAGFSNEVWGLEFTFKPLRMMTVDLMRPNGQVERKLLWYLVYNVNNTGERLRPVEDAEGEFTAAAADPQPVTFHPHFVLEGQDLDSSGEKIYKAYLDRVLPAAVETIRRRETPGRMLVDSSQMPLEPIAVSTDGNDNSVWGVAIWEDVDPEMDYLSIYVAGLTNAHVWADSPGEYRAGDPAGKGRRIATKTLQLNFWRPGDEFLENEREIRYGVPAGKASIYDVDEGVAYRWTFR